MSPRGWILAGLAATVGLAALGGWLFLNVAHTEGFWAFVGVIVGGLITATVSIGGELIRGWQGSSLDKDKRANDRWIERMRIQRDTLLEIQVRLTDWFEAIRQKGYTAILSMQLHGEVGHGKAKVSATFDESTARLRYLVDRVRDDTLRASLKSLRDHVAAFEADYLADDPTFEAITSEMGEIENAYDEARDDLGEVLREYL